jgi:hypothetical protein
MVSLGSTFDPAWTASADEHSRCLSADDRLALATESGS